MTIRTYKIAATDTKGERVRVRANGKQRTYAWDYGQQDMHKAAAAKFAGAPVRNAMGKSPRNGYVFETVPTEESYGKIWVCQCCMLTHANGECCASDDHGGDGCEPLSKITGPHRITMGAEHGVYCDKTDDTDCDCDVDPYSTSQCEGCGSYLHGERHAFTLWGPGRA